MATTYNKMLLDINEKPNDIITAVQNDTNSRYLDVLLYDNGIPIDLTGCEVKIFMEKPEKSGEIWNDGIITDAENGRCEFLLTTEALTNFGHLQVQISIWKENTEILSSQIFEIIVTKSLLGVSSVEASNEYGTVVILFQKLYEAYELMTTMVQNVGNPGELAKQYGLKTMWDAWEYMSDYISGYLTNLVKNALANASVQGVLDILGATGDTGGSTTAGTTMAKLNAILSGTTKVQTVKSIQRGVTSATAVTINVVNPDRCLVILNNSLVGIAVYMARSGSNDQGDNEAFGAYLIDLTSTELSIGQNYENYSTVSTFPVSWQIIEFY